MHTCLNCKSEILDESKFCSNCGQKVDSNNLKLSVLIHEFFENYVSLDTQFGRSIIPFLFKPGFLTKKFILGIRQNFANPFRLYILTSILFFSGFSLWFLNQDKSEGSPIVVNADNGSSINEEIELSSFDGLDSVTYQILNEQVGTGLKSKFNAFEKDEFIKAFNSLSLLNQKRIGKILPDSIQKSLALPTDSVLQSEKVSFSYNDKGGEAEFNLGEIDFGIVVKERLNGSYTDEALLDSLSFGEMSDFYRFVALRVIHVYRSDSKAFTKYLIKNLSIMMLFVLPVTAFLLLFVFYKSKMRYVEHLIHCVHLHSFAYFSLGITFFLLYFLSGHFNLEAYRSLVFLIILIHLFISFKMVYGRSWLRTIFKSFLVLFFYNFIIIFFILVEVSIAFLLF